jgi:putative FmdB family regulatory protein
MLYDYKCRCGHTFDAFNSVENREFAECPKCGEQADKVLSLNSRLGLSIFKEFVTDNITGTPIMVTSKEHKKQLMRQHGLEEHIHYIDGDKHLSRWV